MGIFRTARDVVSANQTLAGRGRERFRGIESPWADTSNLLPVLIGDLFGLAAWPVTRDEAMTVPPLQRARNLLCTLIGRMPLRSYTGAGDVAPAQPLFLTDTDRKLETPFFRMVWTVDDLLFYGESLWLILNRYAADNRPRQVTRIPFDDWEITADNELMIDAAPVPWDDVIYFANFVDGILTSGARAIRMASGLDRAALDTARAPFKLELHQLSNDAMTDAEIAELIAGARKALAENHGILFTNAAIQANVHAYAADNLLTEGRNYSAIDMARLANVPAATIDATLTGSGITYQTGPALSRALVDYGAAGYMSAISSRLSQEDVTPAGQSIQFDLEAFLGPLPPGTEAQTWPTPPAAQPSSLMPAVPG